jgi:hypothetical protein
MYCKSLIQILLVALFATGARADMNSAAPLDGALRPADRIVVRKADRRMDLLREGAIIAS